MISKRLIFTLIFLVVFLLHSEAISRGGGGKSRIGSHSYSAGNLTNDSKPDPGRAIAAIVFMILSCGGGIGWKIYRCYQNERRRKFIQPRVPYPNSIYTSSSLTSIADLSNKPNIRETSI